MRWLKKLKGRTAKILISTRISRLREGNYGDSAPVRGGLSEMRVHYGPGYRIYFKDTGKNTVLLLCGGEKSTQDKDISMARELAKLLEWEK
jgi:putative addiction module killer protein